MGFPEEQYDRLLQSLNAHFIDRAEALAATSTGPSPLLALFKTPPASSTQLQALGSPAATVVDNGSSTSTSAEDGTRAQLDTLRAELLRQIRPSLWSTADSSPAMGRPLLISPHRLATTARQPSCTGVQRDSSRLNEPTEALGTETCGVLASALQPDRQGPPLPGFADLEAQVDALASHHSTWQTATQAAQQQNHCRDPSISHLLAEVELYHWWLVGHVTAGLHATAMQLLLRSTLPLMQEIDYWEAQASGTVPLCIYLIATAPVRSYHWLCRHIDTHIIGVRSGWQALGRLQSHSPRHSPKLPTSETLLSSETANLASDDNSPANAAPDHIGTRHHVSATSWMTSFFPDLLRHWPELATLPLTPGLLFRLARQEIRQKRQQLLTIHRSLSVAMGLFVASTAPLTQPMGKALPGRDSEALGQTLADQVSRMASTLDWVNDTAIRTIQLAKLPKAATTEANGSDDTTVWLRPAISQPEGSLTATVEALRHLSQNVQKYQHTTQPIIGRLYSPSLVTRYWLPVTISVMTGRWLTRLAFSYQGSIGQWLQELKLATQDYLRDWVLVPLRKVWETIRHNDSSQLALMSADSLATDFASLERMVLDFVQAHQNLATHTNGGGGDLLARRQALIDQVHHGDLSVVLRSYEHSLQNPIRNALFGDLIQTLLIQVQKTKVDIQVAMSSLDKLLKANELNFAFLAVAPALVVTYFVGSQLRVLWVRSRGRSDRQSGVHIRLILRDVERLLNLHETGRESQTGDALPFETQGYVLCLTNRLRDWAQQLPNSSSATTFAIPLVGALLPLSKPELPYLRRHFLQDVRDLEDAHLTCRQRIQTIRRMHQTYQFL
ncbi:Nuclear control of ATPase protein 2 [Dimargaris verticillata]|uniref:Nuclear control of ATPase protein 2 n=1 Tax=Dimargaris verticillata TaxID=2761393 RepID=A0A9W8AZN5_9FUNG|nr:Nuclear control of ATPase protein 2 [Dimargaris verticillata]